MINTNERIINPDKIIEFSVLLIRQDKNEIKLCIINFNQ